MKSNIKFSLLEQKNEPDLMDAIKDIMVENNAHNLNNFDHGYWNWSYKKLPTGHTDVFVGKNEDEKILAYYHVPYYKGKLGDTVTEYAMIQDVAVSNQLRGQGVFSKIATFANQHIDKMGTKIIYTFPNHRSIHTFIKYNNFKILSTFKAYILPVNVSILIRSKINLHGFEKIIGGIADVFYKIFSIGKTSKIKITRETHFTEDIMSVYKDFSNSYKYGLVKDSQYLNWRFIEKPNQQSFLFSIKNDKNEIKAVVVLKKDTILNLPCLLLMDYAHTKDGLPYLLNLLLTLRNQHKKYFHGEIALIFTSMNSLLTKDIFKSGFIKIPQKINPRPLNLLYRSNIPDNDIHLKANWHVTLCDWDVF